jgi:hypothetical protein
VRMLGAQHNKGWEPAVPERWLYGAPTLVMMKNSYQ